MLAKVLKRLFKILEKYQGYQTIRNFYGDFKSGKKVENWAATLNLRHSLKFFFLAPQVTYSFNVGKSA